MQPMWYTRANAIRPYGGRVFKKVCH